MKPRVSILSPDFKYVPAVSTDVARTFARIRREQRQRAEQQCPSDAADVVIGVAAKNGASSSLRLCEVPNHALKAVLPACGAATPQKPRIPRSPELPAARSSKAGAAEPAGEARRPEAQLAI
jgi:hypothetical protein